MLEALAQSARRHKDGLHRAHAVVVVELRRQLLGAQLQHLRDLACHVARTLEAGRIQHDLRDEGVVWHHHGTRPEQGFQVVRQLRPAGVARVHGDEHVAGVQQRDRRALEHEAARAFALGLLDGQDLLRDHRQHLQLDAVELIEAGPGTGCCEALEELRHGQVVQSVTAVEHHALYRHGLGQVLGALRLAGASRS